MSVLLLRLSGPMQSWGVESRFAVRDTGREPSKSGVTGLLCAALGRCRREPVEDLASLRMGVRVDAEGILGRDYHTAMNVLRAKGGVKDTEPSSRYYLADARFLVGLEGDDTDLLSQLHRALRDPHWPLYLGRKAFVPGEPVWLADGLRPGDTLLNAVTFYPWRGPSWQAPAERLRAVLEDPTGAEVRLDQPVSFTERRFLPRHVRTIYVEAPPRKEVISCTSPD
jgi:CRISPR system Cascade subunit CasD